MLVFPTVMAVKVVVYALVANQVKNLINSFFI